MTKRELKTKLLSGKILQELFPFRAGQGCDIFKAKEFAPGSDILYVPDLDVHDIPYDTPIMGEEDIEEALSHCYTGDDFLKECRGDEKITALLFHWCDWQSPSAAAPEVIAAYSEMFLLQHFLAEHSDFHLLGDTSAPAFWG